MKDCAAIGIQIAEALACLHDAGLVHRDLKPSNIIFIGGVPKLADVGLVARTDSPRTFVGTEGFIPPEGPGTPQADIYSLGKCLYEMATGKDRQMFPSPPAEFDTLPDFAQLRPLNEIINRACEPDPARRYPDARALLRDLRSLQAGQPLASVTRRKRNWALAVSLAALALIPAAVWLNRPALRLEHSFSLPYGEPANCGVVGDFNGDQRPELVVAEKSGHASVYGIEGQELLRRRVAAPEFDAFSAFPMVDLNGDGLEEQVFGWQAGTNLHLAVLNQRLVELHRSDAVRLPFVDKDGKAGAEGFLAPAGVGQARGSEAAEWLETTTTGAARKPGELRCYGTGTQPWQLRWRREIANGGVDSCFADLAGTGQRHWIVGFGSTGQPLTNSLGEDDLHSYFKAFAPGGAELWSITTGGKFTQCHPLVVPHEGTNLLFALTFTQAEARAQTTNTVPLCGRILRVSPRGHTLATYDAGLDLYSLVACDVTGDSRPELLATDGAGFLHVLDLDLQPLKKLPITPRTRDWVELWLAPPADLDGDGSPELVFYSRQVRFRHGADVTNRRELNVRDYHDLSLLIYDSSLKRRDALVVSRLAANDPFRHFIGPADARGRRLLALLGQDARFYRYGRLWPGD